MLVSPDSGALDLQCLSVRRKGPLTARLCYLSLIFYEFISALWWNKFVKILRVLCLRMEIEPSFDMKITALAGYEPWKNPGEFVFHYTSTSGLIGILNSQTIWLTNSGFLNDTEELAYGANVAAERLRVCAKHEQSMQPDDSMTDYVVYVLKSIAESLECISDGNPIGVDFPYVSCFSTERDDLSQWRGYAPGGYCIAFHRDSLGSSMIPVGGILGFDKNIPMLEDVEYGSKASEIIDEHVSLLVSHLRDRGPGAAPEGVDNYYLIKHVLLPGIIRIKHPAFFKESEVRMYAIDPGDVKFRPSDLGPVPYMVSI